MQHQNHAHRNPVPQKPFVAQQQTTKQIRDGDEFGQSYVAMLNVMRRIYDLGGDPGIKAIIDKAELALARAR